MASTIDLKTGTVTQSVGDLPVAEIGKALNQLYETYAQARSKKEKVWNKCWAEYFANVTAIDYLRSQNETDQSTNWRHKIAVGKAYGLVETVTSYLMGAFFPNRDWFALKPREPGYMEEAKLVKQLISNKLKDSKFQARWEEYTRQLLVCGFSGIEIPWDKREKSEMSRVATPSATGTKYKPTKTKKQENKPAFKVMNVFDVYLDPLAVDPNESNVFRLIRKTKGQVLQDIAGGLYPLADPAKIAALKPSAGSGSALTNAQQYAKYAGIEYDPSSMMELQEFWGDITVEDVEYTDVCVTIIGKEVLRFEANPYWGGKPFVFGSAIPVPGKVYGMGILEPVLGLLYTLNTITCQRLDSLELAVDAMWTVVNDGVTDPDDIYTRPGKVIQVGDPGSITPMRKDTAFTISYQEAQVLEADIDKATGISAYIGGGEGRSGERVTAQEVAAVRDAGGNRLTNIHAHIEGTQLAEVLRRMVSMLQQFTSTDEIVTSPAEKVPGGIQYDKVGPEEINKDYSIDPVGADFIADEERDLEKIMQFVQLVLPVPQWAQMVNWQALLEEVIRRFGFESSVAQMLMQSQQPQGMGMGMPQGMPQGEPMDDTGYALQNAQAQGGAPMQAAMQAEMELAGANATAGKYNAALGGIDPQVGQMAGQVVDQQQAAMMGM